MPKRIDWPDLLLGLFLLLVATLTLVATRKLGIGTAANMGPGYMPRVIAIAVMLFGAFFTGRGLLRSHLGIARVQLRSLIAIPLAVALFSLLVEFAGLAIASLVTIIVAAYATHEFRAREAVIFGVAIAALSVLLFVQVLSLPLPIWPDVFG
ncbi:tripartite tricarboxylate transporter TctB family protein [Ferrovibrio terrae]|uniref:Tripartite tricarboxylate transporter TctB family protein n=1 Tax=Ferrovibrio terrae TaxID=2594003 RepID=A0A516H3U9_9PROT|nr:tripartite tricarboxylate transporter TctB family protein [Ferrovibrio terrae]QDO98270.1 tripartite tricarboxylate transporter TctB family protein [Ferrovibrio terrae]